MQTQSNYTASCSHGSIVQPMLSCYYQAKDLLLLILLRGCLRDHAVCVEDGNPSTFTDARLTYNVEEGDMRVWMHSKYSVGTHKLLFSPDANTYNVGIGISDYVNVMCMCRSTGFVGDIHLSKLVEALDYDHCMATIPHQI